MNAGDDVLVLTATTAGEACPGNAVWMRLIVSTVGAPRGRVFSAEDAARSQLLFQRTIPDFEPSPNSYALAVEVLERGRAFLASAGVTDSVHVDLWTGLIAGLASQQLANDPGGDRWLRLIDEAVDMYAVHVLTKRPARRKR